MQRLIAVVLICCLCLPAFAHEKPYEQKHVQRKDGMVFVYAPKTQFQRDLERANNLRLWGSVTMLVGLISVESRGHFFLSGQLKARFELFTITRRLRDGYFQEKKEKDRHLLRCYRWSNCRS